MIKVTYAVSILFCKKEKWEFTRAGEIPFVPQMGQLISIEDEDFTVHSTLWNDRNKTLYVDLYDWDTDDEKYLSDLLKDFQLQGWQSAV